MAKPKKQSRLEAEDIESLVFDAMRFHGMIPPLSTDEVQQVEAELEKIKLPFGPSNPLDLLMTLDKKAGSQRILQFTGIENDVARNLARAAREGGELSAEIEERMARDKANHEQERGVN